MQNANTEWFANRVRFLFPAWLVFAGLLIATCTGCMKSFKSGLENATNETGIRWHERFDEALAESAATGKPILVDFTGTDWCVWCIRLKEEVFETEEFLAWAEDNVVLLELDYPRRTKQTPEIKAQNKELSDRFEVESFPTVLFVSPSGQEIGRTGYVKGGPEKWLSVTNAILNPAGPLQ